MIDGEDSSIWLALDHQTAALVSWRGFGVTRLFQGCSKDRLLRSATPDVSVVGGSETRQVETNWAEPQGAHTNTHIHSSTHPFRPFSAWSMRAPRCWESGVGRVVRHIISRCTSAVGVATLSSGLLAGTSSTSKPTNPDE